MDKKFWPADAPRDARSFRPNLPKCERLAGVRERTRIIARGKNLQIGNFVVSILPAEEWGLALFVRKEVKPACYRNYLKRVARAAYRNAKPFSNYPKKIAITIKNSNKTVTYHDLWRALSEY